MQPQFECNCDTVLAMEEHGVSVEDILQYASAVLPRSDLAALIRGLESLRERPELMPNEVVAELA